MAMKALTVAVVNLTPQWLAIRTVCAEGTRGKIAGRRTGRAILLCGAVRADSAGSATRGLEDS